MTTTKHGPARLRRRIYGLGTAAAVLAAGLLGVPAARGTGAPAEAPAEEVAREVVPVSAGADKKFDPATSVEVVEERDAQSSTFRNADGSMAKVISAQPKHYRTANGWEAIDNSIVPDKDNPGAFRNAANSFTARFDRLDRGVSVASDEGTLTMRPRGAAPVKPVVSEDKTSVTYEEALPGIDLRYYIASGAVREDIVLKRRTAAPDARIEFVLEGADVAAADHGGLKLTGGSWKTWGVLPPEVLDKGGSPRPDAKPRFSAASTAKGADIAVTVDRDWLATVADSDYPIVIDPDFYTHQPGANNSNSYQYNNYCAPCRIRVGNPDIPGYFLPWRGVAYFPYENLYGYEVLSASLRLWLRTAGTQNGQTINVYHGAWDYPSFWSHLGWAWAEDDFTFNQQGVTDFYRGAIYNRVGGYAVKYIGQETNGLYTYKEFNNFNLTILYRTWQVNPYIDYRSPASGSMHTSSPSVQARYQDGNYEDWGTVDFTISNKPNQSISGAKPGNVATYWASTFGEGFYTWQTQARDDRGGSSGWYPSWNFTVDGSPPGSPNVSSPTHPGTSPITCYSNSNPQFNWSLIDTSGIAGWSYDFNQNPTHVPDQVDDSSAQPRTYAAPQGDSWFHIRARNGMNMWTPTASTTHFQVRVDTVAPSNPSAAFSTSHQPNIVNKDRTIDVQWTGGADTGCGVSGYDVQWTNSATPPPAGNTVTTASTSTTSPPLGDHDTWYAHIYTKDRAGNSSAQAATAGPYRIDGTGPGTAVVISSSTHPDQNAWDTDANASFSWTAASDPSGIVGYSVELSATPPPYEPDDSVEAAAAGRTWSTPVPDSVRYFYVRPVDGAGNGGTTAHYKVMVDSTAPGNPMVSSSTHPDSTRWYSARTATFNWTGPSDTSGINGYSTSYDTDPNGLPPAAEGDTSPKTITVAADGSYWFHVRARNGANTWGIDAGDKAFKVDTGPPTAPLKVTSPSGHAPYFASSNRTVKTAWTPGTDSLSGVEGYVVDWNTSATTPPSGLYTTTLPEYTKNFVGMADTAYWFHVQTKDKAGNLSTDKVYGPVYIDSNASADPVFVASTLFPEIAAQSDEIGLEQSAPYRSFPLGTGTGYVQLRNGNLVASFDDVSVPGQGLNTVIRHIYNSRRSDPTEHDTGLSPGWTLSVADLEEGLEDIEGAIEDIDLMAPINTGAPRIIEGLSTTLGYMIELTDGDGTTHRFTRMGGVGTPWRSPAGVSLRVREVVNGGLVTGYQFVRPDGVVYHAKDYRSELGLPIPSWRLERITDRNDNQLSFSWIKVGDKTRLSSVSHSGIATPIATLQWNPADGRLQSITSLPGHTANDPATDVSTSWERRSDFTYDGLSRLSGVIENAHTTEAGGRRTTGYGYDGANRLASVTDPMNKTTSFGHIDPGDGNRVASVTDRSGAAWLIQYNAPGIKDDPANSLTTVTAPAPGSGVTTYEISPRGEVGNGDRRIAGGNIRRISDAGNDLGPVTTRYAWNQNRLTATTDGTGASTNYEYNDLGLVTKVVEPVPNDMSRQDLPPGAATTGIESVIEWAYTSRYPNCTDPPGDPAGTPVTKQGLCYSVADMTRTTFASNFPVSKRVTDFGVDTAKGNLQSVTYRFRPDGAADANDRTTSFTHYGSGALKTVNGPRTDIVPDDVTTYGDTNDAAFGGYHRTGQPQQIVDALAVGKTKTFRYTPYGPIGKVVDRDNRTTLNKYDGRDNLVETIDAGGGVDRIVYDANDSKVKETSAKGTATGTVDDYTTIWCHDARGMLVKLSKPGTSAAAPLSDPCSAGNLGIRLPDRVESLSAFNQDGTKLRDVSPLGAVTDFEYYPNMAAKLSRADTTATTARAETQTFYDAAGRVKMTRGPVVNDAGQRPETETTYTPSGAVAKTRETIASGGMSTVLMAYNAHNEPIQTKGPRMIDSDSAEEKNTYNPFGEVERNDRLVKTAGQTGRWIPTTTVYDKAGQQISSSQATGLPPKAPLTTTYKYDGNGQVTEQSDPQNNGHVVFYEYSGEGQQTKKIDKVNGTPIRTYEYVYNPDNTKSSTIVTDHTKDPDATLASCNFEAGAAPASGYDMDGNLLVSRTVSGTAGCASGSVLRRQTFAYDGRNLMTSSSQTVKAPSLAEFTKSQSFTYNNEGDPLTAVHDGKSTSYAYSVAGWLESMTDWRNKTTSISYFPSGSAKTQGVGGAANGTFGYHQDGAVSNLTWRTANAAATLQRSHSNIVYDEGGLRKQETVEVTWPAGVSKSLTPKQASYDYDLLDRLVSWTSPFIEEGGTLQPSTAYTLDDGGNIESEIAKAGMTTRSTADPTYTDGKLTSKSSSATSTATPPVTTNTTESWSYTSLGEESVHTTTEGSNPTNTVTTTYDPMGHASLVNPSVAVGQSPDVTYAYDTADRLIWRSEQGTGQAVVTLYFYWGTGGTLAEETDGAGSSLVRYLIDNQSEHVGQQKYDSPWRIGRNEPSFKFRWMLPDATGNPATYVDDAGLVVEQAAFDPYGREDKGGKGAISGGGANSSVGFQGAITDKATKNVILGARLYDPTAARFTTPDAFVASALDMELATDSLTGNRYLFAAANPVSFYEDGHWPKIKIPSPMKALKKAAKIALPALSFVPVVGTAIDVVSAATGRDLLDGGRKLSGPERALMLAGAAAGMVPGAGTAVKAGLKGASKLVSKAKTADKVVGAAAKFGDEAAQLASCAKNSFVPGTAVLMADGSTKAIEDVDVGDLVWATDPETGESAAKPVTELIEGVGLKHLVDVTVDGVVVSATDGHPFWTGRGWVQAGALEVGDQVLESDGDWTVVSALRQYEVQTATVHNFTVAGLHTYYVQFGEPVLVHNIACPVGGYVRAAAEKGKDLERVGPVLTKRQAMEALARGENIYTPTRSAAKRLAKNTWRKVLEEMDKLGDFPKYKHFHEASRKKVRGESVHIFYGQGRRM